MFYNCIKNLHYLVSVISCLILGFISPIAKFLNPITNFLPPCMQKKFLSIQSFYIYAQNGTLALIIPVFTKFYPKMLQINVQLLRLGCRNQQRSLTSAGLSNLVSFFLFFSFRDLRRNQGISTLTREKFIYMLWIQFRMIRITKL